MSFEEGHLQISSESLKGEGHRGHRIDLGERAPRVASRDGEGRAARDDAPEELDAEKKARPEAHRRASLEAGFGLPDDRRAGLAHAGGRPQRGARSRERAGAETKAPRLGAGGGRERE